MRWIAVVLAAGAFASQALAAAPLTVHGSFDSATPGFGDAIATHVVVQVDPQQVDAGSVRVVADLAPLTSLSPARTSRKGSVVTVDRTATCAADECVAEKGDATPRLPRIVVTATSEDGRPLRVTAAWPELRVQGRVSAADVVRLRPPFRVDTSPPPPRFAIAPDSLTSLLIAVAVAFGLAALLVAIRHARRVVRERRAALPVDELARALRLAREAEGRPAPDKRRALGLLARLLGKPLATEASDLAWSRPPPERESLHALVGEVEREVTQ